MVLRDGEQRLTRNVSPIIQAGVVLPSTKKLPMHLLAEILVIAKSAELTLQLLPPKDMVTFTSVLQAGKWIVTNGNSDW